MTVTTTYSTTFTQADVSQLQKFAEDWTNTKVKNADDAITSTATDGKVTSDAVYTTGLKTSGASSKTATLPADVTPSKIDATPMPPHIPASLNEEISGATPITTGYDKAKLDLSGVMRLNSDTSGATVKTVTDADAITQELRMSGSSAANETTDTSGATVKTVTDADAITQELRMSGSSATNETTDTSGAKLKALTSGSTTSTAYDSTITGTKYKFDITTTDLRGSTDYTANSSYTSTETDCTWKTADIDALKAATVSWNGSSSGFAAINNMTGETATDVTLFTANVDTDMFSYLR